ncbi:MAG: helix-turn-helix domain-containing protein, partial [Enterococcus sp.]|nr:helix-turn-helix domain-containing protein [Enterococcus sp.]
MKQQKLLNQNEIARKLGISRGTLSKWLKKNSVFPKQLKGQQKLYEETVIDQYKKDKTGEKEEKRSDLSPTSLLLNQLEQQQKELDYLKDQLEKKDVQLAKKEEVIEEKDKVIADFGKQLGELKYQVQSLDLPKIEHTVSDAVFKTVSETDEKETVNV